MAERHGRNVKAGVERDVWFLIGCLSRHTLWTSPALPESHVPGWAAQKAEHFGARPGLRAWLIVPRLPVTRTAGPSESAHGRLSLSRVVQGEPLVTGPAGSLRRSGRVIVAARRIGCSVPRYEMAAPFEGAPCG